MEIKKDAELDKKLKKQMIEVAETIFGFANKHAEEYGVDRMTIVFSLYLQFVGGLVGTLNNSIKTVCEDRKLKEVA